MNCLSILVVTKNYMQSVLLVIMFYVIKLTYCGIYTFSTWLFFVLWCSTFWDEYVKILTIIDSVIYLSKIFSDLKNIHLSRLHTYIYPYFPQLITPTNMSNTYHVWGTSLSEVTSTKDLFLALRGFVVK